MIEVILWDIDNTLLDFSASERAALGACFARFGLGECSREQLERYSAINRRWWRRLERGECSKEEILRGRFAEFFAGEGLSCADVDGFNLAYQLALGDTVEFRDGGRELLASLRGRVRQYAVTNGTRLAQARKIKKSGLDVLLDGVFISEEVGYEKPDRRFFDRVLESIGPCRPDRILIVGDSLTSDMAGGNGAGLLCCWYDPENQALPEGLTIHFHIQNLNQVRDLLDRSPAN